MKAVGETKTPQKINQKIHLWCIYTTWCRAPAEVLPLCQRGPCSGQRETTDASETVLGFQCIPTLTSYTAPWPMFLI